MGEETQTPMHYHVGPDAEECASCGRDFSDLIHLRPVQAPVRGIGVELMAVEVAELRAEVAHLREERDRFRAALEEIVDPISAMQRWAEAEGYRLDGVMAVRLAKDPGHLQGIARRALTPTGADHDKEVTHGDC